MYGGFLGAFDRDILDIKDRVSAFPKGFPNDCNRQVMVFHVLKSITSPITIPNIGKRKSEYKEMRDGRLNEGTNSLHKVEDKI